MTDDHQDYASLFNALDDWSSDHEWLVRYPGAFNKEAADYIWTELLGREVPEDSDDA